MFKDKNKKNEFYGKDSGELLRFFALQDKDEPILFDVKGRKLTNELLKGLKIREIFDGIETKVFVD